MRKDERRAQIFRGRRGKASSVKGDWLGFFGIRRGKHGQLLCVDYTTRTNLTHPSGDCT